MIAVECKCGFTEHDLNTVLQAEVIADRHESSFTRRAYQHATKIIDDRDRGESRQRITRVARCGRGGKR